MTSARQNIDALLPILGGQTMEFDDDRGGRTARTRPMSPTNACSPIPKTFPTTSPRPENSSPPTRLMGGPSNWRASLPNTLVQLGRIDEAIAAHRDFVDGKNFKFSADEKATNRPIPRRASPRRRSSRSCSASPSSRSRSCSSTRRNTTRRSSSGRRTSTATRTAPSGPRPSPGSSTPSSRSASTRSPPARTPRARQHFDQFLNQVPARPARAADHVHPRADARGERATTERRSTSGRVSSASIPTPRSRRSPSTAPASSSPSSSASSRRPSPPSADSPGGLGRSRPRPASRCSRRNRWASPPSAPSAPTRLPKIAVTARNIEKLKVSVYPLNLESYFRKTHELGRIDHLDIDLIEPEQTWEVKLDDYKKYRN